MIKSMQLFMALKDWTIIVLKVELQVSAVIALDDNQFHLQ
jgi:hypothetical protein